MASLIQVARNVLSQRDPLLPNETKRIVMKELLQAYTLDFLYNHPDYRRLNFYGGTCLHIVYGLNRLSEDIDLDNSSEVDLGLFESDLLTYFRSYIGYPGVTAKTQAGEWGIRRTTLKFPILYELGLSAHAGEALHLKVEVSLHKQVSILQKTPVLQFGRSYITSHFSLETMMAGKLIDCLERDFHKGESTVKGRDYYDILWFMQQKIRPLEEKLAKDGQQPYTTQSALALLNEKVQNISPNDLAADLLPLFEKRMFIEAWLESFKENFSAYYQSYL